MDIWDELATTAIRQLGSRGVYIKTATGERTDPVSVIPIDESETYAAMRGQLMVEGGVVVCQVLKADVPLPVSGDRIEYSGLSYEIRSSVSELNGVWVLRLVSPVPL